MVQFLNGYILDDSLRRWFLPSRIHFLDNSFPLWLRITTVHFLDGFVDGIFYQRDQSYKLKKRLPKIFFHPKFQTPLVTITNHDNFFPRRLETSTTFFRDDHKSRQFVSSTIFVLENSFPRWFTSSTESSTKWTIEEINFRGFESGPKSWRSLSIS